MKFFYTLLILILSNAVFAEEGRPRARDVGVIIGTLPTGPHNAITDVAGVAVGHVTLIQGSGKLVVGKGPVRTGVTAIVPHPDDLYKNPIYAAAEALSGYGEMTGYSWIHESGLLESPIMLTTSNSIGTVYEGVLDYGLEHGHDPIPVVGECSDGSLNDTNGRHVKREHAVDAIKKAKGGPVEEGSVGAGTGMRAFDHKAGIGTASRVVNHPAGEFTVGVLVNNNIGGPGLTIAGIPVWEELQDTDDSQPGGSLCIVVATDAPLLPLHLRNLCARVPLGVSRTGSISRTHSGDFVVAFSTSAQFPRNEKGYYDIRSLRFQTMNGLYQAVIEATEEAILNSLFKADTMVGRDDRVMPGLPIEQVREILRKHGRLAE